VEEQFNKTVPEGWNIDAILLKHQLAMNHTLMKHESNIDEIRAVIK
jgi:hypothetical protein